MFHHIVEKEYLCKKNILHMDKMTLVNKNINVKSVNFFQDGAGND